MTPDATNQPTGRRAAWGRGLVLWVAIGIVALLPACHVPPDPMPPPTGTNEPTGPDLSTAPWARTPPNAVDAIVPGIAAQGGDLPPTVGRAAELLRTLTDPRISRTERSGALLRLAAPTCAIGGYGLPLDPADRKRFAVAAVEFFELGDPGMERSLAPPWTYRRVRLDEFRILPPRAIRGWMAALRLPDLPAILTSGGEIVLLTRAADIEPDSAPDASGLADRVAQRVLARGGFWFCAVWLPDPADGAGTGADGIPGEGQLAALHVVRMPAVDSPDEDPEEQDRPNDTAADRRPDPATGSDAG